MNTSVARSIFSELIKMKTASHYTLYTSLVIPVFIYIINATVTYLYLRKVAQLQNSFIKIWIFGELINLVTCAEADFFLPVFLLIFAYFSELVFIFSFSKKKKIRVELANYEKHMCVVFCYLKFANFLCHLFLWNWQLNCIYRDVFSLNCNKIA